MPTPEMFWRTTAGVPMAYSDGSPVPLVTYRCRSYLRNMVGGVWVRGPHKCKLPIDHDGDHQCICTKSWANGTPGR